MAEFHACLQVQKFAERKAPEVVALHNVAQLQILFFEAHDGWTGKYNFQIGETVVAHTQFAAPVGMLEYLVDQQYLSAPFLEFIGEVDDTVSGEIEIVHVDKEAWTVGSEFLFGVLKQESGFSHATCSFDTNQSVTPVYFVHQVAADRGIGVLNKVGMCAVECFHLFSWVFRGANISLFLEIAK